MGLHILSIAVLDLVSGIFLKTTIMFAEVSFSFKTKSLETLILFILKFHNFVLNDTFCHVFVVMFRVVPTLTLLHLVFVSSFLSFAAWKKLKVLDVTSVRLTLLIISILWISTIGLTSMHRLMVHKNHFFCLMEETEVRRKVKRLFPN